MSEHAAIATLLDASRRAHQRYRDNIPHRIASGQTTVVVSGDLAEADAAFVEACRLRLEAEALDPHREAPAWRDEPLTHNHDALMIFYGEQLSR